LVDHEVTVELKNDIQIRGTLKSVDQYLNIKLDDIQVVEDLKYPHLVSALSGRTDGAIEAASTELLLTWNAIVVGQECLHQRKRGQIRASARKCGRYSAAGRW
jgi:small nuclear ribonucleoprotein (snRNP)-like protein